MKIHRLTSAIGQLLASAIIASDFESGSVQGVELLRTIALAQQAPLLPASIGTGKFYTFDSPGLNDLGRSYFLGAIFAGSHSHNAVWSETASSGLSLVGIDDTPIADTSKQLELPQPPVGNGLNQLAFRSDIVTSPSSGPSRLGIWSGEVGHELHLTAFEGENPPGFPSSVQFFSLNSLTVINETGRIAFRSFLAGAGAVDALGNGNTIWATAADGTLQLIARGNSHPLGMSPDARFGDTFSGPQIDAADDIYFHTTLSDTTFNGVAIVRYRDGAGFSAMVKSGDQAPGLPGGVRLELDEHSENFQLGHLGGIALDASLVGPGINESNYFGIWAGRTADQLHLVFQRGQPIPDLPSQTLAGVYSYSANGIGDVAMSIQRTDGATGIDEDDIWKYDADHGLQLVARQGEHAPGTPAGVTFDSFLGVDALPHLSFNDFGQVAFIARLAGPGLEPRENESLWVQNRNGQLQLVARAGDLIDVDNGPGTDLRTVLGVTADLSGTFAESDGLNNLGEIAFTTVFTDGSNGVFVSRIGAVSEPSTCMLSAVCFLVLPLMRRLRN